MLLEVDVGTGELPKKWPTVNVGDEKFTVGLYDLARHGLVLYRALLVFKHLSLGRMNPEIGGRLKFQEN
jgi:hypothetical protein